MRVIHNMEADYGETLQLQEEEFDARVDARKRGEELPEDLLIIAQHHPVYTLGLHADERNLLLPTQTILDRGAGIFRIQRGGDITYHGPGQLTVYPIVDLQRLNLGVKKYVHTLEEAVIRTIAHFNIMGERIEGATGVWIDAGLPNERKISAIGIRCSRNVAMHGLALNVGSDLSAFSAINPCGFTDRGVTSISRETGRETPLEEVIPVLESHLTALLQP